MTLGSFSRESDCYKSYIVPQIVLICINSIILNIFTLTDVEYIKAKDQKLCASTKKRSSLHLLDYSQFVTGLSSLKMIYCESIKDSDLFGLGPICDFLT
jgi:hypothetical protein